MRKFPRPSHTKPITGGCISTSILLVLTALCPPLAIIFLVIYSLIKDNISFDNFFTLLQAIGIIAILVLSPIVIMVNIFVFGFKKTWEEYTLFVIISILEVVITIICIISTYIQWYAEKNETPEQRDKRIKQEVLRQKEEAKRIKEYRLNKPFNLNDIHIINIQLYDQLGETSKFEVNQQISRLVSQNKNLSRSTWEVYYRRILVKEPNQQEVFNFYLAKRSEIWDKYGLTSNKSSDIINLLKSDWDIDWLSAAIKWNVDLGRYNWMKKSDNYPHINLGELPIFDNNTEISPQIDSSQSFSVFITPAKKKYHKHDCIHIKNRTDLTEVNIKDAETSNIQPCKICFKNKF